METVKIEFTEKSLKCLAALMFAATSSAPSESGKALRFGGSMKSVIHKRDDNTGKMIPGPSPVSDVSDYAKVFGLIDGTPEFVDPDKDI